MVLTFWSIAIPFGAAVAAYAIKPALSSAVVGAVVGLVGYYAVAASRTQNFQYGIAPAPSIQLVPSQNPQAYSPLVISGRQDSGSYIF